MGDTIRVDGAKPWDGDYEFDLEGHPLTVREWGLVRRHSGYMPMTIKDGVAGGDLELINVFAVIAIIRSGKAEPAQAPELVERLLDIEGGRITLRTDTDIEAEDADAGPPPRSSNGNEPSSGDGSPTSTVTSAVDPKRTGTPVSATSASAHGT